VTFSRTRTRQLVVHSEKSNLIFFCDRTGESDWVTEQKPDGFTFSCQKCDKGKACSYCTVKRLCSLKVLLTLYVMDMIAHVSEVVSSVPVALFETIFWTNRTVVKTWECFGIATLKRKKKCNSSCLKNVNHCNLLWFITV